MGTKLEPESPSGVGGLSTGRLTKLTKIKIKKGVPNLLLSLALQLVMEHWFVAMIH